MREASTEDAKVAKAKAKAMERIRRAASESAREFSDLGEFGSTISVREDV